jgi:hypothetical protein
MPRITKSALFSNTPNSASIGPPSAAKRPNIEPSSLKIEMKNAARAAGTGRL